MYARPKYTGAFRDRPIRITGQLEGRPRDLEQWTAALEYGDRIELPGSAVTCSAVTLVDFEGPEILRPDWRHDDDATLIIEAPIEELPLDALSVVEVRDPAGDQVLGSLDIDWGQRRRGTAGATFVGTAGSGLLKVQMRLHDSGRGHLELKAGPARVQRDIGSRRR